MSKPTAIHLQSVSKRYFVRHYKPTLTENLFNHNKETQYWALKNINLKINPGERIGVVGPNGAGKTTLLKIIAGIAKPTSGQVITSGKVVSLIDMEAGFNPELSGYENIFLNGLIIGMSKNFIKSEIDNIVNFADIGDFISAPLYTYSYGMRFRLGFSIATAAQPNILLLDEGFMAGDKDFQSKITHKLNHFIRMNTTILISSHWLAYLKKMCTKLIYLDNGRMEKTIYSAK